MNHGHEKWKSTSKDGKPIKNRWSGEVQFTAEIEASESDSRSVKVGLAVRWAFKNKVTLRDADLSGADLSYADLSGVPKIENIDAKVLEIIEKSQGLEMGSWHGEPCDETNWCGTTHCRAGAAICAAGKEGFELARRVGDETAGILLYLKATPDAPIPNFFANNEEAMADIRARAAKATGATS